LLKRNKKYRAKKKKEQHNYMTEYGTVTVLIKIEIDADSNSWQSELNAAQN
jgi:hypothetical protein